MASLKEHFAIKNYEQAESYKEAICIGRYYRITVLSDVGTPEPILNISLLISL